MKLPKRQRSNSNKDPLIDIIKKINHPIIVEGKKDRQALEQLGIKSKIYEISGKPLYELCEKISSEVESILVLTDYDKEGKRLAAKLTSSLQRFGVSVDVKLRREIFKVSDVVYVESFKVREE